MEHRHITTDTTKKSASYIYFTHHAIGEADLYALELRTLFGATPNSGILFSDIAFTASRSIFIKKRLEIYCKANTLDGLLAQIEQLSLSFDSYKIEYIKHNVGKTAHLRQITSLNKESFAIKGSIELYHPKTLLGLTEIEGVWYFGALTLGKNNCDSHVQKPHSYSASCGVRVARVMANLATLHDLNTSVIDPCCGVGTVVLELLSIGANTSANELYSKVVTMATENLQHFGYDFPVQTGDICDIETHYDAVVLDIPYGIVTSADVTIQKNILTHSHRMADKLVLLTHIDLTDLLSEIGYTVTDQACMDKGKFRRYLMLCERSK